MKVLCACLSACVHADSHAAMPQLETESFVLPIAGGSKSLIKSDEVNGCIVVLSKKTSILLCLCSIQSFLHRRSLPVMLIRLLQVNVCLQIVLPLSVGLRRLMKDMVNLVAL